MTTHINAAQDFSTLNNNLPEETIIKLNQNQIQDSARVLGQAFIQDPFLSASAVKLYLSSDRR